MYHLLIACALITQIIGCGFSHEEPASLHVVYGEDDRAEVARAPEWQEQVRATGLLFYRDISTETDDSVLVPHSSFSAPGYCASMPFREQPLFGVCTGFLIGDGLFATAGHCVRDQADCENFSVTFGHHLGAYEPRDGKVRIAKADVFHCERLVYRSYASDGIDLAILRLTDTPDAAPVTADAVTQGTELTLISHPFGLPKKIAPSGKVREILETSPRFRTEMDFARVGSGSPVFASDTKRLVGMALRGHKDFRKTETGCREEVQCVSGACKGESVLHASEIARVLSELDF